MAHCRAIDRRAARAPMIVTMATRAPQAIHTIGTMDGYRNYEREAHELVQVVISSSLERLQREQEEEAADRQEGCICTWPKGAELTPEAGLNAIQEYAKVPWIGYVDAFQ